MDPKNLEGHLDGDRLCDYAEGQLAPEARRAVEAHLQGCGACRRELEVVAGYFADMAALDPEPAPADFLANVHARLPKPSPWKTGLRKWLFSPRLLPAQVIGAGMLAATALVFYRLQDSGPMQAPVVMETPAIAPAPGPAPSSVETPALKDFADAPPVVAPGEPVPPAPRAKAARSRAAESHASRQEAPAQQPVPERRTVARPAPAAPPPAPAADVLAKAAAPAETQARQEILASQDIALAEADEAEEKADGERLRLTARFKRKAGGRAASDDEVKVEGYAVYEPPATGSGASGAPAAAEPAPASAPKPAAAAANRADRGSVSVTYALKAPAGDSVLRAGLEKLGAKVRMAGRDGRYEIEILPAQVPELEKFLKGLGSLEKRGEAAIQGKGPVKASILLTR